MAARLYADLTAEREDALKRMAAGDTYKGDPSPSFSGEANVAIFKVSNTKLQARKAQGSFYTFCKKDPSCETED